MVSRKLSCHVPSPSSCLPDCVRSSCSSPLCRFAGKRKGSKISPKQHIISYLFKLPREWQILQATCANYLPTRTKLHNSPSSVVVQTKQPNQEPQPALRPKQDATLSRTIGSMLRLSRKPSGNPAWRHGTRGPVREQMSDLIGAWGLSELGRRLRFGEVELWERAREDSARRGENPLSPRGDGNWTRRWDDSHF